MFDVKTAASGKDVNVRVFIELAAASIQGTEDTHFDTLFASTTEHSSGGATKQIVEQDVLLFGNPLPGGFHAAGTAGFWFAALAEETGMGTA